MFDYFVVEQAYVSFYTFIVCALIYYLLHIYNKKWAQDSNDFVNPSAFIVFIAPIAAMVLLLTAYIPVSSRPIEWKWLDDKLYYAMNFRSRSAKTANIGYFGLSSTGFGNDGNKLGSDVVLDRTLVFKAKSPKKLYLKGRSSDQYTGFSWVNTNISYYELDSKSNKLNFDNFELENGIYLLYGDGDQPSLYNADVPNIFYDKSKINVEIRYENINTYSLFAPLKVSNLYFPDSEANDIFVNAEGVLISRKLLGKGFNYSFDTYGLKYGDKDFEDQLRKSRSSLYEDNLNYTLDQLWIYIYRNILSMFITNNIDTDINIYDLNRLLLDSPNAEAMKENLTSYLLGKINVGFKYSDEARYNATDAAYSLINTIDFQRMYGNGQNIFEWIITLADLKYSSENIHSKYLNVPETVPYRVKELALSITRNEQNNYDKVKAIEQYLAKNYKYNLMPGDVPDDVDFVDYFLFERKEGYCTYFATAMAILTRCVGIPSRYVEGYLLPTAVGKDKMYEVTNERAHAWVEVYFEGIGWIQFEPTASFSHNLYQATASSAPQLQTPTPTLSSITPTSSFNPKATDNQQDQNKTTKKKIIIDKRILAIIAIVAATTLLIALIVFLNIFRRKRRISDIAKLPSREAVFELYKYYLKLMSLQNADIKEGETPLDHARRLDGIGKFYPYKMEAVTEIFIKARYSRDEITPEDLNKALEFYKPLLAATKENFGRLKYILSMYVLFKI